MSDDQRSLFDDLFDGLEDSSDVDYGKPIATKLDSRKASELFLQFTRGEIPEAEFDAGLEECILRKGMTAEEIHQNFPPTWGWAQRGYKYNRIALMRAIVLEERRLIGKSRPEANIRNFWYTNLMYTMMRTLNDTNVVSILAGFTKVLHELVVTGKFRYSDINMVSEKSGLCKAIFRDSPYPNIIIASEKASYHQHLQRLADIFKITFISLGGQGSYQVYEDLVTQFMECGIDINQEFFLYCVTDFDPEGYDIQATAKKHLQTAGIPKVTIRRVYLKEDQISAGMVDYYAVPYEWQKGKHKSSKAALTKYNRFGESTGGIYKRGDNWIKFNHNGRGYDVPQLDGDAQDYDLYRIELDNFLPEVLLNLLIDALEEDIDGGEYFRQKAWLHLHGEGARGVISQAAWKLGRDSAEDRISDSIEASSDLHRALSEKEKWLEGGDEDLEEMISKERYSMECYYEGEIADIDSQIEDLKAERADLENGSAHVYWMHEQLREVLYRIRSVRSREVSELHSRWIDEVDEPLKEYPSNVAGELEDSLVARFADVPDNVLFQRDYSEKHEAVFEAARSGETTFEAEMAQQERTAIEGDYRFAVYQRGKELLSDIEVPDPPDAVLRAAEVIEEIETALETVSVTALSADDEAMLKGLRRICDDTGSISLAELLGLDVDWDELLERLIQEATDE